MDEYISRQAVVDWLQKWNGYLDNDMIARMQYRVVDIPSERQWIPVTERLPEPDNDIDILVTYIDGEETRIVPVNYGRGIWFDCIFDRELNPVKITAWMPLPKPWKGEVDERIKNS